MASMQTLSVAGDPSEGTSSRMAGNVDQQSLRRIVPVSIVGNALESYDFFLCSRAAVPLSDELFFPKVTDFLMGTPGAFAGVAVGVAARPLGGTIFCNTGDRFGREGALIWTLSIIGGVTFLIHALPTYTRVEVWVAALLLVLRTLHEVAAAENGAEAY